MNRKLFALLLVLLTATSAFGAIAPELAASDPRIGPYIDFTKQNGASLLPGRYMNTEELDQIGAAQKIIAPTNLVLEIAEMAALNPQQKTYSVNMDVWGDDEMTPMYMLLDFSGAVPVLKTYAADDDGQYEVIAEAYAVVLNDSVKRIWCLASTETGEVSYMCPLDSAWFPEGWYRGSWKSSDGTTCTFSDNGQASINGQVLGKFIVSDNRIVITRSDRSRQLICGWWNPDTSRLVLTFMDDDNDDELNAAAFTRQAEKATAPVFPPAKPKASSPVFPPAKKTAPAEQPSAPQMPTEFPKMPEVKMPEPPRPNIDGVWGAYVNGQQWVVQYQGNQYYGWINGQPSEMGIISFSGNTMTGQNNKGESFSATVQLEGNTLTLTFPNGNAIQYQKLQ